MIAFPSIWTVITRQLGFQNGVRLLAPQAAVAEIIVVRGTDEGEQREGNHYQA